MQEEKERQEDQHDIITSAVRNEWDRRRHVEKEMRQAEEEPLFYTAYLQEQRRHKLMTKKASVFTAVTINPLKKEYDKVDADRLFIKRLDVRKRHLVPKVVLPEPLTPLKEVMSSLVDNSFEEDDLEEVSLE